MPRILLITTEQYSFYNKAFSLDTSLHNIHSLLAFSLYHVGKTERHEAYQDAIRHISIHLQKDSTNGWSWYLRYAAQSEYGGRNARASLFDITKAMQLLPDQYCMYLGRAALFLDLQEPQKALDDLDVALKHHCQSEYLCGYQGSAYSQMGKHELAEELFKKALVNGVLPMWLYSHRALMYYRKGDYLSALADIETYIRMSPTVSSDITEFAMRLRDICAKM